MYQGIGGTLSDLRNFKASQKQNQLIDISSGTLQKQQVLRQFIASETEPAAKEAIHSSMGTVMKKANTGEYPKEGSPSQTRHGKPTSFHITPSLVNELAKISQGNSERMLIENAEPTTPISSIIVPLQVTNPQVFHALNALSQLAPKVFQSKILSSL